MGILEKTIRKKWYIYYFVRVLHEYFLSNLFYEEECKAFKYLIKKKNLKIIDIGASNKVFSRFISRYFNNSLFYCFEPLFFLHKQLLINKNNNKSILIKKGCGEKSKKIKIYIPYKKIFNIHLYLKFFSSIDKNFLIKQLFFYFKDKKFFFKKKIISITKLDNFNFKPDIIKIDTENYELEIILGALKMIKKNRPIMLLENPCKKIDLIFQKLNYQKFQYLKNEHKFKKVKNNNKLTYNYFYLCKKRGVNNLFKF